MKYEKHLKKHRLNISSNKKANSIGGLSFAQYDSTAQTYTSTYSQGIEGTPKLYRNNGFIHRTRSVNLYTRYN